MISVTSFYRFLDLAPARVEEIAAAIESEMVASQMLGLVLVAPEGLNGTVAGSQDVVDRFKKFVLGLAGVDDIRFKDSVCETMPFHRLSVEVRPEIVGMKRIDLVPSATDNNHLSPSEWHAMLESPGEKVMIDTRNEFETRLGRFRGAVDPGMKKFSEWGSYLDTADLPREIPIMIYCTGGIRCEKAILEMQARGFEHVVQLRDGILGYLEEFPEGHYEGECFVFDDRVAVDNELRPSERFGICPGCGLTSGDRRACTVCDATYFVCENCVDNWEPVCSKSCRDLYVRHGEEAHRHRPSA